MHSRMYMIINGQLVLKLTVVFKLLNEKVLSKNITFKFLSVVFLFVEFVVCLSMKIFNKAYRTVKRC